MPRITEVYIQPFDSVQGIADDARMSIGRSFADDIHAAVREDHYCDDSGCDIAQALEAGAPQTAAGLLIGATECAHVDAVIAAHAFNRTLPHHPGRDVYACPDWDVWKEFRDAHGVECGACGSFTYGDSCWTPESCACCGADLS